MVIIIRKDLKMRTGKIVAQAGHAMMGIFFNKFKEDISHEITSSGPGIYQTSPDKVFKGWFLPKLPYFDEYINGSFTKVCVYVNSEEELDKLYKQAKEAGIHCNEVIDAGLTEFKSVPTKTCIAIGPWASREIDKITRDLTLL